MCQVREDGNRWQCLELPSPLIYQEPTASPACSVICLHATLLRKLPGNFSGPYAVLQSWPWDGQRKLGACAFQLQASLPCQSLTGIEGALPMALTEPAGFCEATSCWMFKHQALRTRRQATPWGMCGYSLFTKERPAVRAAACQM